MESNRFPFSQGNCGYISNRMTSNRFRRSYWIKVYFMICNTSCICHTIYMQTGNTLYNDILRIARNLLETRKNIKIESHPFYHIICDWFSWESSKKRIFFWKKKIQNGGFSKWPFFKIDNSQKFFVKISWIGPWVSRIDWCEGHWCSSTYMVVRLSDIRAKTAKKRKKGHFSLFLSLCQTASRPYRLSYINALRINQSY